MAVGDTAQPTDVAASATSGTSELDEFVFGTSESPQMETILSELETMSKRTYGQYCGLSRALEIIGERWALLIVRDLLANPKGEVDLRIGLPKIPADVLATRLRELADAGVVRLVDSALPDAPPRYELTEFGLELDDVVLGIGRWGARMLGEQRDDEIVTASSLVMAMRTTFQPQAAQGVHVSYEVRLGQIVFGLTVADGELHAAEGPLAGADLTFEPGTALKGLMSGEITAAEVIADGSVPMTGDPALLATFAELFHITDVTAA